VLINKHLGLLYKFIRAPRWESMRQVENNTRSFTTEHICLPRAGDDDI